MDKSSLIQQLVANKRCPLEQSALEKLSHEELQPLVEAFKEPAQADPVTTPVTANTTQAAPADLAKIIADAVAAAVAPVAAKVDGLIANQKTAAEAELNQLVAELVANEACPLPESALKKLDLNELRSLQAEFTPADYSGRGGVRNQALSGDLIPADELEA